MYRDPDDLTTEEREELGLPDLMEEGYRECAEEALEIASLLLPEEDYEVLGVSEGSEPGGIIHVALGPEEMRMLTCLAEYRGEMLSQTLRAGLYKMSKEYRDAVD